MRPQYEWSHTATHSYVYMAYDPVPPSGHYMYRTVVTICTAHWSLYVQPSGYYMYRQFNIQQFYVLPTQLYLCVLCGSQNKQPLFPYTTLTGLYNRDGECSLRGTDWSFIYSRGGNLSASNTLSEIGKHWVDKNFRFFPFFTLTAGPRLRTQVSPCEISDG